MNREGLMVRGAGAHPTRFIGGSGGGSTNAFTLTVARNTDTDELEITMRGGTVVWHHHTITVPETVFPAVNGANVWLELDSVFPPDLETPPTITPKCEVSPISARTENTKPARKYWQIGDVTLNGDEATINQTWDGHIPWPGPWAFWM